MVLATPKKGSSKMKSIFDGALRKVTARTPLHDLTEATMAIQTALAGQGRGKDAGSKKSYGADAMGPAKRLGETSASEFAPPKKASEPPRVALEGIIESTGFAEAWRPNSPSGSVNVPEEPRPSNPAADLLSAFSAFQKGLAVPGSLTEDAHQASPMGEVMEMFQRHIVPGWGLPVEPEIARQRVVPTPEGAQFLRRTYVSDAGSRDYKLYVPTGVAGAARAERLPLIVMLHGCKQDPDDFALGTGMNKLAQERGFLVAYPEQSARANQMACWNWFHVKNQERETGEPSIIAGITSEIMSEFDVDPDLVFVAGLSAGGAMAAILGATYPDLFKAAGIHSGLPCGAATDIATAFNSMRHGAAIDALSAPETNVRTIVFQGGADRTVHPSNADLIVAFASAGLDGVVETKQKGRSKGGVAYERTVIADSSGAPQVEYWAIQDMGHAWSGGNREGSFTDPHGPDASREMLRFFLDHRSKKKA
jgi:poly(hydroxyalkanoate) depolymerase family esterase